MVIGRGGAMAPARSASCARSDFSGRRIGTLYPLAAGRRIFYLALGGGAGAIGRAQVWGRAQRQAVAIARIEGRGRRRFLFSDYGWRWRSGGGVMAPAAGASYRVGLATTRSRQDRCRALRRSLSPTFALEFLSAR